MRSNEPSRAQRVVLLARSYPGRTLLLLLAVGAGLYVLIVHLLPSQAREVRAAIAQVRAGILDGSPEAVLDRVAPDFHSNGFDKPALAAYLRRVLPHRPVQRLDIALRRLQVQDGTARAVVRVRVPYEGHHLPSDWDLALVKVKGRWMLLRAEAIPIDDLPTPSFPELTRMD